MIDIKDLFVRYGRRRALDGINLTIRKGESVLLAGANGSGKTTLLRAVAGVLFSNQGRVEIDNREVGIASRFATAYISATLSFYEGLKLGQAVRLYAERYRDFRYQPFDGFRFDMDRKVSSLSRGERTLFLLNLALCTTPSYLLVDDVIHFLDPHLREIFLKSILERIEQQELALVMAAQVPIDIEGIVERVVLLDRGRVRLDESMDTLKRSCVKTFARQLPDELPVIFSREWEETKEFYIYPYREGFLEPDEVAYLKLSEILRALIGGDYDRH